MSLKTSTIGFSGAANPNFGTRTGYLVVCDKTITVIQSGATCFYDVRPTVINLNPMGGSGLIVITTNSGCPITKSSSVSWLKILT